MHFNNEFTVLTLGYSVFLGEYINILSVNIALALK